MAEKPAPFIPASPEETGLPPAFWRVFGTRSFFKLWVAQVVSSLGDWIGIIAILAIAARVSGGSGAAVSLVMVARVVPGFFLATVGGVIVDRFDRRRVMVACDFGRAGLLAVLPFVDSLMGLVIVSFLLEILSLLWGPAKDASIPNLVDTKQLTSANSLGLFAAFGTFPVASLAFALLSYAAVWLSGFSAFASLNVDREFLALWVDGLTFLVSALIIFRLPIPRTTRRQGERVDWTATLRDISEGLAFIRHDRLVRAVIIGIGVGIIGGGAMIPLGPVFADQVLGGGSAAFGLLMTALGFGAAIGVISLLAVQRRLSRETVFQFAVMATGLALIATAATSHTLLAVLLTGLVRHRLHRPPGERPRRAARPHVRRALHGDPLVPADLADDLAAVGGHVGRGVQCALHRPSHRDRRGDVRASRGSDRVVGWRAHRLLRRLRVMARSAARAQARTRARRLGRRARAGGVDGTLHRPRRRRRQRQEHASSAARRSPAVPGS